MTGHCKPSCSAKTLAECVACIVTGTDPVCNIHQVIADVLQNYPKRYSSTSAPTVDDDETGGYKAGDIWIDTDDAHAYICIDASEGAADWDRIN